MNLSNAVKISLVQASQASGTTTLTTTPVDMADFDGVLFFGSMATADNTAQTNYIKVQEDVTSAMTTAADLAGSRVTPDANTEVLYIDVYQPPSRYVRASIARGVATAVGDIYALQYNGKRFPAQNVIAGTITGKVVATPIEGQA
jgi:hypothetical protein